LLDFEEHRICGTTCKHAHPFVESHRDIDRRELGFSTYRIWWDPESSTAYLACRSARTILPFPHHAPWTAGKRKAQPFDPARRSSFDAISRRNRIDECGDSWAWHRNRAAATFSCGAAFMERSSTKCWIERPKNLDHLPEQLGCGVVPERTWAIKVNRSGINANLNNR
jgi:hypothetical protein